MALLDGLHDFIECLIVYAGKNAKLVGLFADALTDRGRYFVGEE